MTFYIYILHSENAGKFYVGYSQYPWKRLIEHNTVEHLTYTSKYRPWQLKAVFYVGEKESEAIKMERFIKKQKSRVLLENLINPKFQPSEKLALPIAIGMVRVPDPRIDGTSYAGLIRGSLVQPR